MNNNSEWQQTSVMQADKTRLEEPSSQVKNSSRSKHSWDCVPSRKQNDDQSSANRREDVEDRQRWGSSRDTIQQPARRTEDIRLAVETASIRKASTNRTSETDVEHGLLLKTSSSDAARCSVAGESSRICSHAPKSEPREDLRTEGKIVSSKITSKIARERDTLKEEYHASRKRFANTTESYVSFKIKGSAFRSGDSSSSNNVVFDGETKRVKREEMRQASTSSKVTSLDTHVQTYKSDEDDDSSSASDVSSSNETIILNRGKFTECIVKTAKRRNKTVPIGEKSAQTSRIDTDERTKRIDSPNVPVRISIPQQRMDLETTNLQRDDMSSETDIKVSVKKRRNDEYPNENHMSLRDQDRSNDDESSGSNNNDPAIGNIEAAVEGQFSKGNRGRRKAEEYRGNLRDVYELLSKKSVLQRMKEKKRKKRICKMFRKLFGKPIESENEEDRALLTLISKTKKRRVVDSCKLRTVVYNERHRKAIRDDTTEEDEATVTCNLQKDTKTVVKVNYDTNDNPSFVADTVDVRPSVNSQTKDSKTETNTEKNKENDEPEKLFLALRQNVTKNTSVVEKIQNTNAQNIVQNQQENQTACDDKSTILVDNDHAETCENASGKLELSFASEFKTTCDIKRDDDANGCDTSRSIRSSLSTSNDSSTNDEKCVTVDRVSVTTLTNAPQEISEGALESTVSQQKEYVDVMDAPEKKLQIESTDIADNRSSATDASNGNVKGNEMETDIKPKSEHGDATSSTSTCNTDDLKNDEIVRATTKIPDEVITRIKKNEDNEGTSIPPSVVEADVTARAESNTRQITLDSTIKNIIIFLQQRKDTQDGAVLDKDKDAKVKSAEKSENARSVEEKTTTEKSAESNDSMSDAPDLGKQETFLNDVIALNEQIRKARMLRTDHNFLSKLSSTIFINPATQSMRSVPLVSSQSASSEPTSIGNVQQIKELLKIRILKMICICVEQCRIFKEHFIKHSYRWSRQSVLQEMLFTIMQLNDVFQLFAMLLNEECCYSVLNHIVDELNRRMLKDCPTTYDEILTYMILNSSIFTKFSENADNNTDVAQPSNAAFAPDVNLPSSGTETLDVKKPQFSGDTVHRGSTISNNDQRQSTQDAHRNVSHPTSGPVQTTTSGVRSETHSQNARNNTSLAQGLPVDFSRSMRTNVATMHNVQNQQSSRKSDYVTHTSLPNTSNSHLNVHSLPKSITHVAKQQSRTNVQCPSNVNSGRALICPPYTNQNVFPPTSQANYRQTVLFAPYATAPETSLNLTGNTAASSFVINPPAHPQMYVPQTFEKVVRQSCENRGYTSVAQCSLPNYSEAVLKNMNTVQLPLCNAPTYSYPPIYQLTSNVQEKNLTHRTISAPLYIPSNVAQIDVAQNVLANQTFVLANVMQQNASVNPQQAVHSPLLSFENASKPLSSKSSTLKPVKTKKRPQSQKSHKIKTTLPVTSTQQDVRKEASAVQNVPYRSLYNAVAGTCVSQDPKSLKQRTAPNQPRNIQREVSLLETMLIQKPLSYPVKSNNFNLTILTDIQKYILQEQIYKYLQMPVTWQNIIASKDIEKVNIERITLLHLYNSLTHYINEIIGQKNKTIQRNQMQSSTGDLAKVRSQSTIVNKNKENNSTCNEQLEKVTQQFQNNNEKIRDVPIPTKNDITKKSKNEELPSMPTLEIPITKELPSISFQSQNQDRNTETLHSDVSALLPDAQERLKTLKTQNAKTVECTDISKLIVDVTETKDISRSSLADSHGKQLSEESLASSPVRDISKFSQDRLAIGVINIETIISKQLDNLPKTASTTKSSTIAQDNNKENDTISQFLSCNTEDENKKIYSVNDEITNGNSESEVHKREINLKEDTRKHASTFSELKNLLSKSEPELLPMIKASMEVKTKSQACDVDVSYKDDTIAEICSEFDLKLEEISIDDQISNPVPDETCDNPDIEICVQKNNEKSNPDAQDKMPPIEKDKADISKDILWTVDKIKYEPLENNTEINSTNLCQNPVTEVQDILEFDKNLPLRKKVRYQEILSSNNPENISDTKQSNTNAEQLDVTEQCRDMKENLSIHSNIKIDEQFLSELDYCERLSTSSVKEDVDNVEMKDISIKNDISYNAGCCVKNEDSKIIDHITPSILNITSISSSLFEKMNNDAFLKDDLMILTREEKNETLHNSRILNETEKDKKCLRCKRKSTVCCEICLVAYYCSERCSRLHWNTDHYKHCKPHESSTFANDMLSV